MEILTYPIGLVVGILPVLANLGAPTNEAQVLLDGRQVCALVATAPICNVDLGPELRVHVLDLVRRDARGQVVEQVRRWINRPGAQAEIYLNSDCPPQASECTASIGWGHPTKLDPLAMTVTVNGEPVAHELRRDIRFRVPKDRAVAVGVDAIFPDGRRASQTRVFGGGYVGAAESTLQAVPIVVARGAKLPTTIGGLPVRAVENAPQEVAFVVEPLALEALRGLWTQSRAEMIVPGAPVGEQVNGELVGLEAMTVVIPNENLNRFDMFKFQGGRDVWLRRLALGSDQLEGRRMRLADAVASAGMAVAGAPRTRAVVVVISGRHKDESQFSPAQVCRYLSEIMVPLFVWRVEKDAGPGWPAGAKVTSRTVLDAVKEVHAALKGQRIAWIESDTNLAVLRARALEGAFTIAGRVESFAPAEVEAAAPAATTPEGAAPARGAASFEGRVDVTAVRVLIRPAAGDGPVLDVKPGELEVLEDGRAVHVLGVERLASAAQAAAIPPTAPAGVAQTGTEPWSFTVYIMPDLCTRGGLPDMMKRVREEARRMVGLGPVTVVVANPEPQVLGEKLTDAAALDQILARDALKGLGLSRIAQLRRSFLGDLTTSPARNNANLQAESFRANVDRAYGAMWEERSIVRSALARLLVWRRSDATVGARGLFLVMDGFDLQPEEFYLAALDASGQASAEQELYQHAQNDFREARLGPYVEQVAATLAARGWTVVTFDNGNTALGSFAGGAEQTGHGRLNSFYAGGSSGSTPSFLALHPREPLETVAETTGGLVVKPGEGLRGPLDRLGQSLLLTYQVDRPADGRPHRLQVRCTRAGVTITAPKLVLSGTAEGESELRARGILSGEKGGDLPIALTLTATPQPQAGKKRAGEFLVRVDLGGVKGVLDALGSARLRVSVAVEIQGGEPFITHDEKQVDAAGGLPGWEYRAPITWPPEARRLAVVVEELASGAWGAAVAPFPPP
jgi:hypothetical protein